MKNIIETREIHRKAMRLAQDAYVLESKGDSPSAVRMYEEAFYLEKEAALALLNEEEKEPTSSVLFRSAAALALNCKLWREAEKMIAYGLSGNPTNDLAQELRDLYSRIPSIKPVNEPIITKNTVQKPNPTLIIVGTFKMADAENNIIKILANTKDTATNQKIEVPKGLNEIVKMYLNVFKL